MTPRQHLTLEFIKKYMEIKGYAPSYRNIAEGLKIKSKSNIHRLVHELCKQGVLEVDPHKVRSLRIVDKTVKKISKI